MRAYLKCIIGVGFSLAACKGGSGSMGRDTPAAMARPAAPAAAPVETASPLAGTAWQWIRFVTPVETITADDPTHYTIAFGVDSSLTVRADCNRGRGRYAADGGKLTFSPIALTRMGCPPGSLDTRFAAELQRVAVYSVRGDTLLLELPVDSGTLLFLRAP